MAAKSEYLQIRVSTEQKKLLRRIAAAAGQDVSAYVLSRALPAPQARFLELIAEVRESDGRHALAALNDLLAQLPASSFREATAFADLSNHSDEAANYIAAMVEHCASRLGVAPPAWTARVPPLETPLFAGGIAALRPWLLLSAPVAFKKRNIFVDSTIGDRV